MLFACSAVATRKWFRNGTTTSELSACLHAEGLMKGEYNGRKITMRPGSCWIQPKRIKHTVLDYSRDCEMLEIVLPAQFDTVEL
jgi:hypothetical protein